MNHPSFTIRAKDDDPNTATDSLYHAAINRRQQLFLPPSLMNNKAIGGTDNDRAHHYVEHIIRINDAIQVLQQLKTTTTTTTNDNEVDLKYLQRQQQEEPKRTTSTCATTTTTPPDVVSSPVNNNNNDNSVAIGSPWQTMPRKRLRTLSSCCLKNNEANNNNIKTAGAGAGAGVGVGVGVGVGAALN